MSKSRWLALGVFALSLGGGCAGKSSDSEDGAAAGSSSSGAGGGAQSTAGSSNAGSTARGGSAAGGAGGQPAPSSRVPEKHRPAAQSCDNYRLGDSSLPYVDESSPLCTTDADCAALEDECSGSCRTTCVEYAGSGRCGWSSGECVRDADCTAGANGRCHNNREVWSCSYDECFDDSACSTGGPCECGEASGYAANECLPGNCQTDADCGEGGYCSPTLGDCGNYLGVIAYHCHTPEDVCVNDSECVEQAGGYCMYRPELGHWACGYGHCVG